MSYNVFYEEKLFKLLETEDPSKNLVIEISDGEYTGIKYSYGTISVEHDEQTSEDGMAKLNFEIFMEDEANNQLISDPNFVDTAGNILMSVLLDYAEKNGVEDLGDETN